MFSDEIKWRCVVLFSVMNMNIEDISFLLGASKASIKRWTTRFNTTGTVERQGGAQRSARWPVEVYACVRSYIDDHPCFYLEELGEHLKDKFPAISNFSAPTICRALRFDMGLTRKRLEKRAKESRPQEIKDFFSRLKRFYLTPSQLIFVDETSKDGRSSLRKYAYSTRGNPAIVNLPFSRGKRVSAIAAFNYTGFVAWEFTEGTYTRAKFHQIFCDKILPHLNPYPLPNSILILDNAKIHMYQELEDAISTKGAILIYLPPYCPQFNPIETGFSLVKRWVQKNANIIFPSHPKESLDTAFKNCASKSGLAINLFNHSGYRENLQIEDFIEN